MHMKEYPYSMGVRIPEDQRAALEAMALLSSHKMSDEIRVAIRKHTKSYIQNQKKGP